MIEAGEYVRTKNGKIDKVINNNCYMPQYIECEKSLLYKEDIVNHSKDLVDLIEEGDVIEVHFPVRNTIRKIYVDEYFEDSMILNGIISGNVILKTILTKEQYMQNCYKCQDIENGTI